VLQEAIAIAGKIPKIFPLINGESADRVGSRSGRRQSLSKAEAEVRETLASSVYGCCAAQCG